MIGNKIISVTDWLVEREFKGRRDKLLVDRIPRKGSL
jgi:hypothetical protein